MEEENTVNPAEALGKCLQWACSPRGGNNFYGRVLNGCGKLSNPGLGTCGVRIDAQGRYLMEWDPLWFVELEEPFQILVIVHEAVHLILRHVERGISIKRRMLDDAKAARMHEVINVAADMAANDTAIRPLLDMRNTNFRSCYEKFIWPEEMKYQKNLTFEEYLVLLLKDLKKEGWDPNKSNAEMPQPSQEAGSGQGNDKDSGDKEGDSSGGGSEGKDGSPGKESGGGGSGKQEAQGGGGEGKLPEWFKRLMDKKHQTVDWSKALDGMTDGEVQRALDQAKREGRKITRQAAKQTAKAAGVIPGNIKDIVDELMEDPRIPWQTILRGMLRSKISQKLDESTAYPSVALLHNDGYEPYPGFQKNFTFNIIAAFDTSGSMSSDKFKDCRRELCGLLTKEDGVTVRLIQFDWSIQHEVELTSDDSQTVKKSFTRYGQGGTSFGPPLRYAGNKDEEKDWVTGAERESQRRESFDLMLMFTDGEASIPLPKEDPKIPVIWVLTSNGQASAEMKMILRMTD